MALTEAITIAMKLGDWVNTIWNFHAVINVALLGWVFSKRPEWSLRVRVGITGVYALLMAANLYGQIEAHIELDAVLAEVRALAASTSFKSPALAEMLLHVTGTNYFVLLGRHLVVDAFGIAAIWIHQESETADK